MVGVGWLVLGDWCLVVIEWWELFVGWWILVGGYWLVFVCVCVLTYIRLCASVRVCAMCVCMFV